MTLGGPRDPGPGLAPVSRGSRLLPGEGGRSILVALVSTAVVFSALGLVVVNAPGWPEFQAKFLDRELFLESLPKIAGKFSVNVQLFLIAEALILVWGLLIAVFRSLPGPVFFPVRLLATIYVDVFRALPGLLVIFMIGFGIPGLGIGGLPSDPFVWAVFTLALLYSAYVSEVYRAGINAVPRIDRRLHREQAQHAIRTLSDLLRPILAPGPDRGTDVVDGAYARLL